MLRIKSCSVQRGRSHDLVVARDEAIAFPSELPALEIREDDVTKDVGADHEKKDRVCDVPIQKYSNGY